MNHCKLQVRISKYVHLHITSFKGILLDICHLPEQQKNGSSTWFCILEDVVELKSLYFNELIHPTIHMFGMYSLRTEIKLKKVLSVHFNSIESFDKLLVVVYFSVANLQFMSPLDLVFELVFRSWYSYQPVIAENNYKCLKLILK